MSKLKVEKNFLNMVGEYGVCLELHKRGINANITFGKEKAHDIVVISDNKAWIIEVKTTMKEEILTKFFQNSNAPETTQEPDFWVLVHIDPKTLLLTDFYVLRPTELAIEQMKANKTSKRLSTKGGVCTIKLSQLKKYKNNWDAIIDCCGNNRGNKIKMDWYKQVYNHEL